jgi:flagellum-specific ATP synthase
MEVVPRLYDALKQNLDEPPVEDVYAFLSQVLPNSPRPNSPPPR